VGTRHPTAVRLIEHGLRLFAQAGMVGTPIVRIEEAAGLAPGSGAFYKHFRSKDELLAAAVADAAASTQRAADTFLALDGFTLEEQLVLIARGTWATFDTHRDLILVLTRDVRARPTPPGYSHAADDFPGQGVALVAAWLRRRVDGGDVGPVVDPEATALVLLDALTNHWLQREAEDAAPYGVDRERFLAAWVDLALGRLLPG
jgi:AcrR family transcriptional regulator